MSNIYLTSKKVHRFLVISIVILALIMSLTGMLLKFPQIAAVFTFISLSSARNLHSQVSFFFSLCLFLMAASGLILYLYPFYLKQRNQTKIPQS